MVLFGKHAIQMLPIPLMLGSKVMAIVCNGCGRVRGEMGLWKL